MHPIRHKINFGEKAGRIAVKFYNGSSVVTGWIVKQTGSRKFKVTADGTTFFYTTLAQTTSQLTALTAGTGPDAALRAGLCTVEVTPYGGSTENVMAIQSKKLLTIQGSHLQWGVTFTASATGHGTISLVANSAPTVANTIPNQVATVAGAFSFTFAANTFADLNKDTLTYTSTLGSNAALPAWLVFDGPSRTFTKAATAGTTGAITVKVIANDGTATVNTTFTLTVS